jgi:peroxiredoxin
MRYLPIQLEALIMISLVVLIAHRRNNMTLKIGDEAPDFTLGSHLDREVTLSDLRGKHVILAFFPLAWTPV